MRDSWQRRAERWRPPPAPRSLPQFARESLRLPDGPQAGQAWIPASEPLQRLTLDEIANGTRQKVVLVWPSQRGKTLCGILAPALHAIVEHRASVGYLMPSLDKLAQNWEGKIQPSIIGAGYGDWLPKKGPGSRGGRPSALSLRDPATGLVAGRIYFMSLGGGGKETAVSSVSPRVVVVDEADDAESEAQLALAFKRIAAYGAAGRAYVVSTVNARRDRDGHPVLQLAARGTMTRLAHRCPHCGDAAPITQARLVGSALVCLACSAIWSEDDRRAALNNAVFHHANPDADILSILAVGPDFHMGGGLAEIVKDRDESEATIAQRGDHTRMRLYFHKVWCEDYTGDKNTDDDGQTTIPTRNRLAALSAIGEYSLAVDRSEPDGDSVHLCEIPAWVEHQAVAVDVQRGGDRSPGRLYFLALGRGGGRGAILGWGSIAACPKGRQPTPAEFHAALDRLDELLRTWAPAAPIVRRSVDVGDGEEMAALLAWLRAHRDWWPIKGTGGIKPEPGDRAGWIYHRQQSGYRLHLIETRSALRVVHGELLAGHGVGSLALPRGLDRQGSLIRHLCASVEYEPGKWSEKPKDRLRHPEWQARDDLGQCAAYARALAYDWEARPAPPVTTQGPDAQRPATSWIDRIGGGSDWINN